MSGLHVKRCLACEGGVRPLTEADITGLLKQVDDAWSVTDAGTALTRTLTFKNYYQTMACVNAIAWIAHQENHHPDLSVHYNTCTVTYQTHAVEGLTENDFICAAKVDQLLKDA